jgi:hypothetical protein
VECLLDDAGRREAIVDTGLSLSAAIKVFVKELFVIFITYFIVIQIN